MSVVGAILHVESRCGRVTGSETVLWCAARHGGGAFQSLAQRHAPHPPAEPRAAADVERAALERACYLESTFYPEVRAVFEIADRLRIDPLALRGSMAGAFGVPQFLPTSYLRFGTDRNGDGRISLYDPEDAVASCARYGVVAAW